MTYSEIKDLVGYINTSSIVDFEISAKDVHFKISKIGFKEDKQDFVQPVALQNIQPSVISQPAVAAQPMMIPPTIESPTSVVKPKDAGHMIFSPLVGTYYEATSPEVAPFVKVGQSVKKGDVMCILEAMKIMNEIVADVDGVVAEIFVENGEMVEARMPLFRLEV